MEEALERVNKWLALNNPNESLNLSRLGLTKLPPIPTNCKILNCSNNKLTSLPDLPKCKSLFCNANKLTVLPKLPMCIYLYCHRNLLTELPELPGCRILCCSSNKLTILPELPACTAMTCSKNELTALPELLQCKTIHCYNNKLTRLPVLPVCVMLHCQNNKYIHISKKMGARLVLNSTPNYNMYATKIQKLYRKFIRRRYMARFVDMNILCRDVSSVCAGYVI